MRYLIIGWYGTETIGDRAILASLIKLLDDHKDETEILLGSIYPFFTERTLLEDHLFIEAYCGRRIKIKIFDARDHFGLKENIKKADHVIMGGGPLMDVSWMYMVEYALMKAKKYRKGTGIIGCGIGPLYHKKYIEATKRILRYSDILIFRDEMSKCLAERFCPDKALSMVALIDPAVFVAYYYKNRYMIKSKDREYIAMNLRAFPKEYILRDKESRTKMIDEKLEQFMQDISSEKDRMIYLVPMHYFGIGGDDRAFMNHIVNKIRSDNIKVYNDPLTLVETMQVYADAEYCVGMRFHSVVLQTIINGNNYVIDYTEPQKGKISGFIQAVNGKKFYKNRYWNIQENKEPFLGFADGCFEVDCRSILKYEEKYQHLISLLSSGDIHGEL